MEDSGLICKICSIWGSGVLEEEEEAIEVGKEDKNQVVGEVVEVAEHIHLALEEVEEMVLDLKCDNRYIF